MEIFFIIFFVLTVLFFLSNKEDTGPMKVLKSIWYTTATIVSVTIILGCIVFGFIHYQDIQEQKREVAYQAKLREEWPECLKKSEKESVLYNRDLDLTLTLNGCIRPSGY